MRKLRIWERRVGFNYCDTRYPGLRSERGSSPVAALHRIYLDTVEREQGRLSRPLSWLAASLFLGYSLRQAVNYLRSHGQTCRQDSGKALWRQFWESLCAQFCFQIPVMDYYANRLYRCHSQAERLGFINQRVLHKLLLLLNPETQPEVKPYLDKQAFEAACRTLGLPCVSSLAMLEGGKLDRSDELEAWIDQGRSFLIKPSKAYGGICVAIFDRAVDGGWRERLSGKWLCHADESPGQHLCLFAPEGCYVVQPLMHNAAWLNPFSNGNLCNFRIVTGLDQDGEVEVISAFLRLPCRGAVLTSIEHDAGCCPIDLQSGILGCLSFMDLRNGVLQVHPDGGGRVEGQTTKNWTGVLALARQAHQAIGGACFAGWDIVDTEESGLLLLESNLLWGANLAQFDARPLLGETAFCELYQMHYERQYQDS